MSETSANRTLTIASWNLNNLHSHIGKPLRRRAPARTQADYARLRKYAERLSADVIAFQEVNGPAAAMRVFPRRDYRFVFSDRFREDREGKRRTDYIYTGFALRKSSVELVDARSIKSLKVQTRVGGVSRYGTDIVVERAGRRVRLLSLHLKSGCSEGALRNPRADACRVLAAQVRPLEAWIDARAAEDLPFVVMGDFNRAFATHGDRDHLWQALEDSHVDSLDLYRLPPDRRSHCWRCQRGKHRDPVDHMVFDDRAWDALDQRSFRVLDYDHGDVDPRRGTPSDHRPIAARLAFGD